ncbi:MAG TPA: glycosyltransferase [Chitinophagaceae bacterium]|nr:glycosyltransferase [Chitinophagaceae bacterium]
MILLIIIITLFVSYAILMIYYWISWMAVPDFVPRPAASNQQTGLKLSVVIPARNEEKNIGRLLEALQKQSYPPSLFEIIVADDHSTDKTTGIAATFKEVKIIPVPGEEINSYKKKALETAITQSAGEWIITTDADCLPGKDWLHTIVSFINEKGPVFITAPVSFMESPGILGVFQSLDFMILQGITAASVHKKFFPMCNGANLAYRRDAFYEVEGFAGIDHIASGDDMLLMEKFWKKYPGRVLYLRARGAIVSTMPMLSWKDFFNQRIRWASKSKHYKTKKILAVLSLVYLFNLSFLAAGIAGFFDERYWMMLVALWLGKTLVEQPFVWSVAGFYGKRKLLYSFFFLQPVHIIYTIVSGFLGLFGKYEWKGRQVK